MRRQNTFGVPLFALALLAPMTASAGMSMPKLTDIVSARLEVISFFLVSYLLLALVYQRLWNSLARDFPKMPRLGYRAALCALVVCGLFIYVVLTMISGARELMTPGAWARSGAAYKIREPEKDPKPWLDIARRESLEKLRAELWRFAQQHGGAFPTTQEKAELPEGIFRTIDPNGLLLVYVPSLKADVGKEVLAYEPESFGPTRMTLMSNGEIVQIPLEELTERVRAHIKAKDEAAAKVKTP